MAHWAEELDFVVEEIDPAANDRIVEVLARVAGFFPAIACFDECVRRKPKSVIIVRHGARLIRDSRRPNNGDVRER